MITKSYGHFCFAERKREREGNVDCVNSTCTSFHIYSVSQKFVSPFSCAKTFDQDFMFHEISRRCLLLYRLRILKRSKVFGKASLSLMKEQFSRLAKSAASNIFSYFIPFGHTGERLIPGLRRKDWILRALLLAVTSPWP